MLLPISAGAIELNRQRIRIEDEGGPVMTVWQLVIHCDTEIEQLLKARQQNHIWLDIRFSEIEEYEAELPHLVLHPAASYHNITHTVARALLWRLGAGKIEGPQLDWLAAAVTYSVLYSARPATGNNVPDYRTIRFLANKQRLPDLEQLLQQKIQPQDSALYHLFALQSHLLLTALGTNRPRQAPAALKSILARLSEGNSAVAAIEATATPLFRPGENLHKWYRRTADEVSIQGIRGLSGTEIAARLSELETVPVIMPGRREFGVVLVPVDELPKQTKVYRLDKTAIANIQGALYRLLRDASGIFENSLLAYISAFTALSEARDSRFRRELAAARNSFQEALQQQQQLVLYLDQVERWNLTIDKQFKYYLQAVDRHEQRQRRLSPRLHLYLDQVELAH